MCAEGVCVVMVCVYVINMAHRGISVLGGAVVRITVTHHQVIGSSPIREVLRSFLVAFQTLPRVISDPCSPWEPLVPLSPRLMTHAHAHTRAHTALHTHTRCAIMHTHTHTHSACTHDAWQL